MAAKKRGSKLTLTKPLTVDVGAVGGDDDLEPLSPLSPVSPDSGKQRRNTAARKSLNGLSAQAVLQAAQEQQQQQHSNNNSNSNSKEVASTVPPAAGTAPDIGTAALNTGQGEVEQEAADDTFEEGEEESELEDDPVEPYVIPFGAELLVKAGTLRKEKMSNGPIQGPSPGIMGDLNKEGLGAVHMAAKNGKHKALAALIELKAELNKVNASRQTPLMLAAAANDLEATERLVEADADTSCKDINDKSANDFATVPRIKRIIERAMVQRRTGGATPSASSSFRRIPGPDEIEEGSDDEPAVFRIRVEELPLRMAREDLQKKIYQIITKKLGARPIHLEVAVDPIYERVKGYAYMDFIDARSANAAMKLDGLDVLGSKVKTYRDLPPALVR
eukprot:TRINITY_DN29953_c4_g1_i1.p1 TRINITY_DN29953_c4_g1~~TRINITY_DN29953_c4_g1_i1.p1  ORF type:complete len:398 (+),score=107.90 TRINITY_DN29953_c4_g1_i1:26-1195(+)